MFHCILTTCGTSLLTNNSSPEERGLVTRLANVRNKSEAPVEHMAQLENLIGRIGTELDQADWQQVMRLSAELNALYRFYPGQHVDPADTHLLLCTDTWLGEEAARLVERWLRREGCRDVHVIRQRDLQTASLESFHLALTDKENRLVLDRLGQALH